MRGYTSKDIVKETAIQWNDDGEGISIYRTHNGDYGLFYWENDNYSSIILDTLEEAEEWRDMATDIFRVAARERELANV